MRKWYGLALLTVGVLLAGPALNTAEALRGGGGRSYSSGGGGRSFSSGSGGGRSYSSGGSSTSGKSYSSGGSGFGGGKSYSSGGGGSSAKMPAAPSGSGSMGRSYSSGGTNTNPSAAPSASPSSGRSYSSSGNPSRPPTSATPGPGGSFPPSANPNRTPSGPVSGKAYSQGGDASTTGAKPGRKSSYDAAAASAQRQAESRATYQKGQAPQSTYSTPTGGSKSIDPRDAHIRQLREDLNYERWRNRDYRMRDFYGGYWSRPVVIYNDPYNSFFWWWLLDRSIEYQALWAYHHYNYMDPGRYQYLMSQNAQLAARVSQLEAQHVTRDPTYVPPGLTSSDLMVTNEYAQAVYNPQPLPVTAGHVLWVLFKFFLLFAFIALLIWLVFFKRWGAAPV